MTFPGRRWVWYGGRPSLDFVNTRRNREAGRADEVAEYLRGPDDFTAWLSAAAGPCQSGPCQSGPCQSGPCQSGPCQSGRERPRRG